MDKLLKKKSNIYYLIAGLYVVISIIVGLSLRNGLVIFLAWNMILATIVYFLSEILVYMYEKKVHIALLIVTFLIWVLFFPNSIYMLTDFIHIQNYQFFESYADIYHYGLTEWIVFTELIIGALFAAKLGIAALLKLKFVFKKHIKKYYYLILSSLFLLSSIGIFLGRFLRLNSWNVFDLISQIDSVFSKGTFFLGFISIFFVIHWFVYFLFSFQDQNIYNKNKEILLEEKS